MSFNHSEHDQDQWELSEADFEALFKNLYPRLLVYCQFKYGFDRHLAEDIVNTSFIKLWEVRQTPGEYSKAYLYRLIDNASLNILKHEKVKQRHVQYAQNTGSESVSPDSFETIDLKQLRTAIDEAVSELPDQMRRIFELSRYEGLKYAQIADELGLSVKTVETQMGRALAKLRKRLAAYLAISFLFWIFKNIFWG